MTKSKYFLIRNETWNLVIRTSMNLNYNPRYENFEISDDKDFAEFHQTIIDEIWSSQKAGECFKVRPQIHKDNFKKNFGRDASILDDLVSEGDLL